jgi:hypothetical protein
MEVSGIHTEPWVHRFFAREHEKTAFDPEMCKAVKAARQ